MLLPDFDTTTDGWVPWAVEPLEIARSAQDAGVPVFYFRGRDEIVGLGVAWRGSDMAETPPVGGRLIFGFPFDPSDAASLVVPAATVYRSTAGTRLRVAPGHDEMVELLGALEEPEPPQAPIGSVSDRAPEPDVWKTAVGQARRAIERGQFAKVVLGRTVTLALDDARPFDVVALLGERFPAAYLYAWKEGDSTFLGASPELLIERRGDWIRSLPLAGSAKRGRDQTEDEEAARGLLESSKDRFEHQLVVDGIAGVLGSFSQDLTVPTEPTVMRLANIQHLGSEIYGHLVNPVGVRDLATALHPTPAVCGTPTQAALDYIRSVETSGRGWYAGGVGWADASGDGEVAVALRCALLQEDKARIYAGAGIMRDSDPESEMLETEAKLRALLDLFRARGDSGT